LLFLIVLFFFVCDAVLKERRRILSICDLYQQKFVAEAKALMMSSGSGEDLKLIKFFTETFASRDGEMILLRILTDMYKRKLKMELGTGKILDVKFRNLMAYWMIALSHRSIGNGILIRYLQHQIAEPQMKDKLENIIKDKALSAPDGCPVAA
jgi:hypothetical protein